MRVHISAKHEKFRGPRDPGHAHFWKKFWGSCPECLWEHLCRIWSL